MSKNGNGFALDDDVKEEIESAGAESDLMGSWVTDKQGGDKIPLVENWVPDANEWQGKTVVNEQEAVLFALARNLPKMFDEISHMQPFIDGFFTDLEQYKTSVDGMSREQQMQVFAAMFGGRIEDEEGGLRGFMRAVASADGENDD